MLISLYQLEKYEKILQSFLKQNSSCKLESGGSVLRKLV